MYFYKAYGLGIHSEMALPQLTAAADVPADVVVRYGSLERPDPEEITGYYFTRATGDEIYYFMETVGSLQIRGGREITIDPLEGAEALGFRFLISGIGLGLLLHQRGIFTLHASAVNLDGAAVGFIGWKRMGKSTTAAALHQRGHAVVTDDLLAVHFNTDDTLEAVPGYPQLKLWPEAVSAALGDEAERLPRIHPDGDKRARSVAHGFEQHRLPLRCIYVLDFVDEDAPGADLAPLVQIEPIPPRDACVELIRHSFGLRILQTEGVSAKHLAQCAAVLAAVPVRRLKRRQDLDALSQLASAIEADARGLAEAPQPANPIETA